MRTASAFAYMRKKAAFEAEVKASEQLSRRLATDPGQRIRVSTKVAKRFLIQFPTIMSRGDLYSTRTKSIGAGVHEVFLRKAGF